MFPSHAAQQTAIAFQLAATLDAYEQELEGLSLNVADAERQGRLAEHFDQMQAYAASLTELSVSWLALMISRAEFTHNLWSARERGRQAADLKLLLDQHREAIAAMRARCTRMMRRS